MAGKQDEVYSNNKPLNLRTRISLKILLLMYPPYEYEHQFKTEINDIAKAIDNYSEDKS